MYNNGYRILQNIKGGKTMNSFREKIFRFMQGRYGSDKLNFALIILYVILGFIRVFIRNRAAAYVFSAVMGIIVLYAVYRMLSRNIYKRQRENEVFCRWLGKVSPHFILLRDRLRDIKTKRYRKCPSCRNVLRLPYKKGKHSVRCPKCGHDFNVHII